MFSKNIICDEKVNITTTINKTIHLAMYLYTQGDIEKSKELSKELVKKYEGDEIILVKIVLQALKFDDGEYDKLIRTDVDIKEDVKKACSSGSVLTGWAHDDLEYYCYIYYSRLGLAYFKVAKYNIAIETLLSKYPLIEKYTNNQHVYYEALFTSYLKISNYSAAQKYILLLFELSDKNVSEISKNELYYNYACLESLSGNNYRALELLKKISNSELLLLVKEDDDLTGFRASEYYKELIMR